MEESMGSEIRSPIRRHHSGKSYSSPSISIFSESNAGLHKSEEEKHTNNKSKWDSFWSKFEWHSFFFRSNKVKPNNELPVNPPTPTRSTLEITKSFFHVSAPFFRGNAKWKAWGLSIIMMILCLSCTGLYVVLSYNQRDFSTALADKNKEKFFKAIWQFVGIIAVAAPLFAVYDYIQGLLMLEWRIWMTELLLSHYFANRSFFDIKMQNKIDNPDQRICQDIDNFVATTVVLITVIVENLSNLFAFSSVLWTLSHELVFFLWFYAALGTVVTVKIFGKKLMSLQFQGLQREANLRYSLVRVRENAEAIAFYRGEEKEFSSTKGFLSRLVLNIRERLVWGFHLSIFNNIYSYVTILIPSLIICPRYFAGEVEFGVISQADFAFNKILNALTFIVTRIESLSGLAAQIERLEGLLDAFGNPTTAIPNESNQINFKSNQINFKSNQVRRSDSSNKSSGQLDASDVSGDKKEVKGQIQSQLQKKESMEDVPLLPLYLTPSNATVNEDQISVKDNGSTKIDLQESSHLQIQNVTISIPNSGQILFPQTLTFQLEDGQSLLIMGPSGCGKSSLLRAIAGLWTGGSGTISFPKNSLFLPQKPYMPLGSLRAQLFFPSEATDEIRVRDLELLQVLEDVALGGLAEKFGGLDAVVDWSDVLSVGEQQRIAFARLLIQKPRLAFLDEATSALDAKNENRLYELLKLRVSCFVSVGHRSSLVQFHSKLLICEDDEWKMSTVR